MIKNIFIRLLSLILLLTLTSCDFSFSVKKELTPESDDDSPYLKYTPEECVKDIDCAWYAFEGMVFARVQGDELSRVAKWVEPVNYSIVAANDDDRKIYAPIINSQINFLSDLIKHPINRSRKNINMIIILSDNFKRDIYGKYKKDLISAYNGTNEFFLVYEKMFSNSECFNYTIYALKDKRLLLSTIFLPTNVELSKISSCLSEMVMMQSFGLFINGNISIKASAGLEKLLLKILYHKSIKPGMKSEEVKPLFYKIYQSINIKSFINKHSQ